MTYATSPRWNSQITLPSPYRHEAVVLAPPMFAAEHTTSTLLPGLQRLHRSIFSSARWCNGGPPLCSCGCLPACIRPDDWPLAPSIAHPAESDPSSLFLIDRSEERR